MSFTLEELNRQVGVQYATHVFTTTVASQTLIAAPGAGKAIWIHYMSVHQSAVTGALHLGYSTTAGTTIYSYPATGPFVEESLMKLDANQPVSVHMAAGGGNGFVKAYYSIRQASGTTE